MMKISFESLHYNMAAIQINHVLSCVACSYNTGVLDYSFLRKVYPRLNSCVEGLLEQERIE